MHVLCLHHVSTSPGTEFDIHPDLLEDLLLRMRQAGLGIVAPSAAPNDADGQVAVIFDDGYASTLEFGIPLMDRIGVPFGMATVPGLLSAAERPSYLPFGSLEFVSSAGIKRWLSAGGELLSHSFSHVKMTALATTTIRTEIENELAAYDAMGVPRPGMFAYPFGESDLRVRGEVAAHYRAAFSTGSGTGSVFDIHRITFRSWKYPYLMRLDWPFLEREEND
jgi:peptidoglycan/xylan/chitin deacetylase (PgdA/CDA1 family)